VTDSLPVNRNASRIALCHRVGTFIALSPSRSSQNPAKIHKRQQSYGMFIDIVWDRGRLKLAQAMSIVRGWLPRCARSLSVSQNVLGDEW
jgi:hypothetical protein